MFRQFQEELLTVLDVEDVEDRVADGARLAVSISNKRQREAEDRLERMVQTASVVIGAFALSFTAAPVIDTPSWTLFLVALAAGIVAMMLTFLVLRVTGRRTGGDSKPPKR